MSKVLYSSGQNTHAYAEKTGLGDLSAGFWFQFDLYIFHELQDGEFLNVGGPGNYSAFFMELVTGVGPSQNLYITDDDQASGALSPWRFWDNGAAYPFGGVDPDYWHTIKLHYDGNDMTWYVDGTVVETYTYGAITSGGDWTLRVGQHYPYQVTGEKVKIRDVRLGTTDGGIETFSDDFSSGNLSSWDSITGLVGVIEDNIDRVAKFDLTTFGNKFLRVGHLTLPAGVTEVYLYFTMYYSAAALAFWASDTVSPTFFHFDSGSQETLLRFDDNGSGLQLNDFLGNHFGTPPPADQWNEIECHITATAVQYRINGSLQTSHAESWTSLATSGTFDYVGANGVADPDPANFFYIGEIRAGLSWGSKELFWETFVTDAGPFGEWDGPNTGSPPATIIDNPEHSDADTVYLALTPDGNDVYSTISGTEYSDSATERLALVPSGTDPEAWTDGGTLLLHVRPYGVVAPALVRASLTPSANEHYCPQKVEFEGFEQSRWSAEERNRWSASETSRWEAVFLGTGEGFAC